MHAPKPSHVPACIRACMSASTTTKICGMLVGCSCWQMVIISVYTGRVARLFISGSSQCCREGQRGLCHIKRLGAHAASVLVLPLSPEHHLFVLMKKGVYRT